MFLSDGTLSAVTYALLLGITCLTVLCDLTKGSSDFSGWELLRRVCTLVVQVVYMCFPSF